MELTKSATYSRRLIECNQEYFQELLTFIDFAEVDKFTLGFIEINFPPEIDILVDCLRQHFPDEEVQFEVFRFPNPSLRFLRDALKEEIPKRNIDPNKKTVLIVRDLEYSIGVLGNSSPFLNDLNYVRNAYKTHVPYPILFVLPDFAMTRVTYFAPDFWDWRSGIFRFKIPVEIRKLIEARSRRFDEYIGSLNKENRYGVAAYLNNLGNNLGNIYYDTQGEYSQEIQYHQLQTINIQTQLSQKNLLDEITKISPEKLDAFVQKVLELRAKQYPLNLSLKEEKKSLQYQDQTYTEPEYQVLIELSEIIEKINKLPTEVISDLVNLIEYLKFKTHSTVRENQQPEENNFLTAIAGLGESDETDLSEKDEEILATEINPIRGWSDRGDRLK